MRKLLLLTLLILFLPLVIRLITGDPLLYSQQSYESFLSHTPYSLLLKALSSLQDLRVMISVLLGVLSAYLMFTLTSSLRYYRLLLVLNPLFMTLFTTLNPYTIAVPLLLLSLQKPRLLPLLTPITALFSPFFSLLMIFYTYTVEKKHLIYVIPLSVVCSLMASWPKPALSLPVAEFGDAFGISILILILSIGELALDWKNRASLLFLFLALITPLFTPALIALSLYSSWFAAQFIRRLVKRKWLLSQAKIILPWLAGCLFLFLFISHTLVLATAPPNKGLLDSIELIEGTVLAPANLHPIIAHFGANPYQCPQPCTQIQDLYSSWQFDKVTQILDTTGIRYILITEKMRSGGVWNRDDEGLLLLLHHSNYFTLLSNTEGYELWRYERSYTTIQ